MALPSKTPVSPAARRRRILESNFGRDGGWYVSRGERRVAELVDPRRVDMFIDSYRIDLVADAARPALDVRSPDFWMDEPLTFTSREFGEVARHATPLTFRPGEPPRLEIRGLYLEAPPPSWWESLLLRWRRPSAPSRP